MHVGEINADICSETGYLRNQRTASIGVDIGSSIEVGWLHFAHPGEIGKTLQAIVQKIVLLKSPGLCQRRFARNRRAAVSSPFIVSGTDRAGSF